MKLLLHGTLMCKGLKCNKELLRRKRSTLSRARRRAGGGNWFAIHQSWHMVSQRAGSFHTCFHGKRCLPDEHKRTSTDMHPGLNANAIASSSRILQWRFAYCINSSQDPHSDNARLSHSRGFALLQILSSHSICTLGRTR